MLVGKVRLVHPLVTDPTNPGATVRRQPVARPSSYWRMPKVIERRNWSSC